MCGRRGGGGGSIGEKTYYRRSYMAVFSRMREMTWPKNGIVGRRTGGSRGPTEGKTTRLRRMSARGSAAMAVSIAGVRPEAVSDGAMMFSPIAPVASCDIVGESDLELL